MIVTVEIPAESQRKIERDSRLAGRAGEALAGAMEYAVAIGADNIIAQLMGGGLGLVMRHPGQGGLAEAVTGWMIDRSGPVGAIGVERTHPASRYAAMLEFGGDIYPKNARALAVPISEEAKGFSSPRDMPGLTLIPRKGRPPLLVRQLAAKGSVSGFELHWVLVPMVHIEGRHWLSQGAEAATGEIAGAFGDKMDEYTAQW